MAVVYGLAIALGSATVLVLGAPLLFAYIERRHWKPLAWYGRYLDKTIEWSKRPAAARPYPVTGTVHANSDLQPEEFVRGLDHHLAALRAAMLDDYKRGRTGPR